MNAGRRAGFGRGRLVALETGLGVAACAVAVTGPWRYVLACAAFAILAGALLRHGDGWADRRLLDRLRRQALTPAGTGADGSLGLAHTLLPALDITEVADRNGPDLGVMADGRGYVAVIELPGGALPELPAGIVATWLEEDPARPAAAQLLIEQIGLPPWDLHVGYRPTAAYRQLPTGGRPIVVRSWLALRYESFAAPEAAERRGGGAAGAHAAVASALARLRARLAAAGVPGVPLGAAGVRDLLRQLGDASGEGRALAGSWAGAATHRTVTAEIGGQAAWSRLLGTLASCAADRVVIAATIDRDGPPSGGPGGAAPTPSGIRVRTAVRIVSTATRHAADECDRLLRSGAVGPPVADQAAGLLATLPLAYPSHPLADVTGFAMTGTTGARR
ncbi:type VII secretion protein EccE [Streptomyces sp. B6B3]|uniref:type VII secretion protein EccE n=1 Tax=Streptomyces sp. B6B3 TaxID=3153570 RepID=UPI00325D7EE9